MVELRIMKVRFFLLLIILFSTSNCSIALPPLLNKTPNSHPSPSRIVSKPRKARTNFPSCEPEKLYSFEALPLVSSSPEPLSQESNSISTMRSLADQSGIYIGAAGDAGQYSNPEYVKLLTREFNMVAVENAMKWHIIHPDAEMLW